MGAILGYARVLTGDQDVAGQTMRLEQAGATRVFTDIRSGKSMDRPGLAELLTRPGDTPSCGSIGSDGHWRSFWKR
ncbi:DNA invertase Pin-like site-specific DNA recombinase [Sinorhizobium kostiense]|uniref:DNA invertase Pin-like site-specific DNA recombinase n=1 Tax=Sinorhizobium kostiense TaxID=76747 RepID=A0ABS4R104_9HYPH|nr:recombinase family protein [Sinorhizobium arboris]MBP2236577.1 DNA invertase Pin-like site-specific DNA recombinase [Sinorhizobium kostiense]